MNIVLLMCDCVAVAGHAQFGLVCCVLRSVLMIAREGKQVTNLLKFIAILSPFISTCVPSPRSRSYLLSAIHLARQKRRITLLSFCLPTRA
jgi:hypothetical protein